MAGLSLQVFIAVTALGYGIATKTNYEETVIKHGIIQRESLLAANAIRNITIATPQSKVQLATMASDFIVSLQYTQYILNNVIPSTIAEVNAHKDLAQHAELTSQTINDIQQGITGDSELLKAKLVTILESFHEVAKSYHEEVKIVSNPFIYNQLKKGHNFLIFGLYKLKYQAKLFDTDNKSLAEEIGAAVNTFREVVSSISFADKTVENELRQILQHIAVTITRIADKLENWVELNSNKVVTVRVLNEIVPTISLLYNTISDALSENHDFIYVKNLLLQNSAVGRNLMKAMAQLDYSDSLGDQEYIRSSLFDVISMGITYADIINSVLSKS